MTLRIRHVPAPTIALQFRVMNVLWKAPLVVVLVSATVCLQAYPRPRTKEPSLPLLSSAAQSQTEEKAAPSAAPQVKAAPSTDASTAEKSAPVPGDSTKLEIVKSVKASYPVAAGVKGIQGQVLLKVSVSEKGDVQEVEVVRGDPVLADSAVKAMKKWKFKPYIKNGKATQVVTQIPFDFAFSDRVTDEPLPKEKTKEQKASTSEKSVGSPADSSSDAKAANSTVANGSNSAEAAGDVHSRVGLAAGVSEGHLIHKVAPIYPEEAKRERIQGTVLLHAIIDKEGRVAELKPISGPKELIPASLDAVQEWRYTPYILNGEAVEVETTITVNFHLQRF